MNDYLKLFIPSECLLCQLLKQRYQSVGANISVCDMCPHSRLYSSHTDRMTARTSKQVIGKRSPDGSTKRTSGLTSWCIYLASSYFFLIPIRCPLPPVCAFTFIGSSGQSAVVFD